MFQPIVSLPDGATVGFESLARWPDWPDVKPEAVFSHASATGAIDALDRMCIRRAIAAAVGFPLKRGSLLCLNAEPATSHAGLDDVLRLGYDAFTIMFEITERSVLAHPHALLRKVAALRYDGFAIALDDVGAQPDSVPLLDVISPDVIKLDLALTQTQPSRAQARTLDAVLAHHERTGAVILAEGIETDEHLEQALAVGATLGQGFKFGRPGTLGREVTGRWRLAPTPATAVGDRSPFDLVADTSTVRTARKETLIALSRHIESQAEHAVDPPMVFTALQREQFLTPLTSRRYRSLATTCPLVAVFGETLPANLGGGVRGVGIDRSDPLCAEWIVVALGPQNATALIAREHDDNHDRRRDDADRRFDFVITYDRDLVTTAVRGLLDRMQ